MTGFDPKSPNVARVYDYGLGGRENFTADREAAVRLLALYPSVAKAIAGNREFVHGQGEAADNFFRAYSASVQDLAWVSPQSGGLAHADCR